MDETKGRSSTAQKFISDEISSALARAGLGYDHPIRADLDVRAEIVGVRDAVVRVRNESDQILMLDDRIEELRRDSRFVGSFPPEPPKVASGDMVKLRENFGAICEGTIVVEK